MEEHLTNINSITLNTIANGSVPEEASFLDSSIPAPAHSSYVYDADYANNYCSYENGTHPLSTPRKGPCKGLSAHEDTDGDIRVQGYEDYDRGYL